MTTTEDREPLYSQATRAYDAASVNLADSQGIRAVVDLVLDLRPEPTADGEALAQLVRDVRDGDGHTVQIDGVLIAQCDERGRTEAERIAKLPWEVLREATAPVLRHGYDPSNLYTVLDVADYLTALASRLQAEDKAAQEKAEREAAREKLIEQAAQVLHRAGSFGQVCEWADLGDDQEFFIVKARALADAGYLKAPEMTDGGEA